MLDTYGLSTICGPRRLYEMGEDEVIAFGERARELDITIAEHNHVGTNVMTRDMEVRDRDIQLTRRLLQLCEAMQCGGTIILVGSPVTPDNKGPASRYFKRDATGKVDPTHLYACPDPYLLTDAAKAEFREVVLRIVDGLDIEFARLLIEPWHHSFFYQAEAIREFMDSLGDPRIAFHLDQMNMMHQDVLFDTTRYIDQTFDLLSPYIAAVHFKDIAMDWRQYSSSSTRSDRRRADRLPALVSACPSSRVNRLLLEHRKRRGDFAINFARLHRSRATSASSSSAAA